MEGSEERTIARAPSTLDDAGRALFRLGRMFDKQRVRKVLARDSERSVELSRIFAVQAVEAGVAERGHEVTVGTVAERLCIDQSTASRLVAETIREGYLARAASEADGRRIRLELTEAGHKLAGDARRYQRSVFEDLTRDWPTHEREEFARLLAKFVDSVAESGAETRVAQR